MPPNWKPATKQVQVERQAIEWENTSTNYTAEQGLIIRIGKELQELNNPKRGDKGPKEAFLNADIQMATEAWKKKKCLASLTIGEM